MLSILLILKNQFQNHKVRKGRPKVPLQPQKTDEIRTACLYKNKLRTSDEEEKTSRTRRLVGAESEPQKCTIGNCFAVRCFGGAHACDLPRRAANGGEEAAADVPGQPVGGRVAAACGLRDRMAAAVAALLLPSLLPPSLLSAAARALSATMMSVLGQTAAAAPDGFFSRWHMVCGLIWLRADRSRGCGQMPQNLSCRSCRSRSQ